MADQHLGMKQGFQPNPIARDQWDRAGGLKAKAIEMVTMLQARGDRTTGELCRDLEITREQFHAVTSKARRFVRSHENADIRALRDEYDGRSYRYWLVFDPDNLLRKWLDTLQRLLGHLATAREIMDVVSAHSLKGEHEQLAKLLGNFTIGIDRVANEVMLRADRLLPGAVDEAKLNARPPTVDERFGEAESEEGSIWDAALPKKPKTDRPSGPPQP